MPVNASRMYPAPQINDLSRYFINILFSQYFTIIAICQRPTIFDILLDNDLDKRKGLGGGGGGGGNRKSREWWRREESRGKQKT